MKYKGEHKEVFLRGIELAGSDRSVKAGGMNELVGLVERDGSFEPYALKKVITRSLPQSKIFMHKTSAGTNVLILRANGNLDWMSYADFADGSIIASATGLTGVTDICIVGNMITDQNLHNVLFSDGSYHRLDTSLSVSDLPDVRVRVNDNHTFTSAGSSEVGSGNCMFTWQTVEDASDANPKVEKVAPYIEGLFTKLLGQWAEKGGLTGYTMAVVAYRLTNGEYILATTPKFLGEPLAQFRNILARRTESGGDVVLSNSPFYPYTEGSVVLPTAPFDYNFSDYTGVYGYAFHPTTDGRTYDKDKINLIRDACDRTLGYNTSRDYPEGYALPMACGLFGTLTDVTIRYDALVTCRASALEYKISSDISESLANSIKSVCIFICKPVVGFKMDETLPSIGSDPNYVQILHRSTANCYAVNINPKAKTTNEIIEELKQNQVFYKIKEIPFNEIKATDGWVNIDLKGKLGDSLYVQETLPVSAFSNMRTIDGKLFAYNNRIHIFDYKQVPFKLVTLNPALSCPAYGQWMYSETAGPVYLWRVIADCKNDTYGKYLLDTSGTVGDSRLMNILLYPNPDCYHMEIRIKRGNYIYRTEIDMEKWGDLPLAVSWPKGFDVLNYDSNDFTVYQSGDTLPNGDTFANAMTSSTSVVAFDCKNKLKVSESAYPYFPVAQTYTIGKSQIIGMASFAIAISQDAYGKNPLLVFCDDGIYALRVDETGALAYRDISPYSREVCLYRNSICMLDSAIAFVSRRGLMICTDNGVKQIAAHAHGKKRHMPQSTAAMGTGLVYYYNALHETKLTKSYTAVSSTEFESYIKHASTRIVYLATKNAVIIYNSTQAFSFLVKLDDGIVSELPISIQMDDGNYPETMFYTNGSFCWAETYSENEPTQCIFQTRPMYLGGELKKSFRFLMRGTFIGKPTVSGQTVTYDRAGIYVLGSLDGEHWKVMGGKEKVLPAEGFHDFGCETYRDSVQYLMLIFTGYLDNGSHIDRIEIDGLK